MTTNAIKLLEDALELSESDRADFAARLIDSLDPDFDEDASLVWNDEIAHRISDLDTGKVNPIPWPDARRLILSQSDGTENA